MNFLEFYQIDILQHLSIPKIIQQSNIITKIIDFTIKFIYIIRGVIIISIMRTNLPKNPTQNTNQSTTNNPIDSKETPPPASHFQRTARLQKNIKKQQLIQTSSTNSNSQISQINQNVPNKPYVYTPLSRTIKTNPSNKSLINQGVVQQKKQQIIKSSNPSFIKKSQIPIQMPIKQDISPVKQFDPFKKSGYTPKAKQVNKQVISPDKNEIKTQAKQQKVSVVQPTLALTSVNSKPNIYKRTTQIKQMNTLLQTETIKKDVKLQTKKVQNLNQTPKKQQKTTQIKKQIESNSQNPVSKIKLVKSKIIAFTISKFYCNKLKQSWILLKENSIKKGKTNKLANLLISEINLLIQKNNKNFYYFVFDKLKLINLKKNKQQFKNQDLLRNRLNANKDVFMCNNVDRLFKQRMKLCLQKLIKSNQCKKNVHKAIMVLNNIQKKKLKQCFGIFVIKTKLKNDKKLFLLQRIYQICKKNIHNCLSLCFSTLLNSKTNILTEKSIKTDRSQITRPYIKAVQSKLVEQVKAVQSNLVQEAIQQPINNDELKLKKYQMQNQIKKLRNQKIQQERSLKQSIKTIKNQNQEKLKESIKIKDQNVRLKTKIQAQTNKFLQQFSQLSTQQRGQSEPTLRRMHQIYMEIYKMTEQQIKSNIQSLCDLYKINEENFNKIVHEWLAIHKNQNLKRQIDQYQNNQYPLSESSKIALQQADILSKFIRSYTKERYMWEQVKDYISEALQ